MIGPADIPGRLKVGDQVIILTKDGQEARFEISMLTPDTIEGREHTIRIADIRTLERREFDESKVADLGRFTFYAIVVVAAVVATVACFVLCQP